MAADRGPDERPRLGGARERLARRLGLPALLRRLKWDADALGRRAAGEGRRLLRPEPWRALLIDFWERVRPVARPLAVVALLGNAAWFGAALFIAYVWPAVLSPLIDRDAFDGFERAADRARGVALVDGRGRRFGVMSGEFDRDHLGELPGTLFFAGLEVHPDHKTLPVEDAPEAFWRCLVWLEDRNRGGWDNPYGVSFTGVLRIPYAMGLKALGGSAPLRASGGSTLEMQLARSMWKQYRHNSNALIRKVREWRAAPVLNRALVRDPSAEDGRRFRAWIASHIALVRGVGGDQGSLYGVENAGRFLFGESAETLDAGEQLILAAAAQRPIRLRESPEERRAALARLVGTPEKPGRALRCLEPEARLRGEPVIADPALRAAARARLFELAAGPYQGPFIDDALRPLLADLIAFPGGPRLEPQAVSRRLAQGLQAELAAELADRHAAARRASGDADLSEHLWRGRVSELQTSVDVAASKRLERSARAALRRANRRLQSGATPRLAPNAFTPDGAPLLLMAMDLEGRVVRYAQTGFDSLALGGAFTRPDWGPFGDGPHDPTRRALPIGSLGKVGAALLLAEAGATDLERKLSNVCLGPLKSRCMDPRTGRGDYPSATPESIFARSLNAATVRALGRAGVEGERVDAFTRALGLSVAEPDRETPATVRLTLGRLGGRPVEALRLMAAALAYAEGDFDRAIPHPRFIERIAPFDPEAERRTNPASAPGPREPTPLGAIARPGPAPANAARFVRRVLEAPLCLRDGASTATLRRLRDWCASDRSDVRIHLAKTGTVGAGGPRATTQGVYDEAAWWVAGAVRFSDGRGFAYVALGGDGAARRAFARRLGAGRLAPAVDALLRDLIAPSPRGDRLTGREARALGRDRSAARRDGI